MYGQVVPKAGNTYIGAPGAVLDGQNVARYAFTQRAGNVTIKYLTIRGFNAPRDEGVVNHDSGIGWTLERNTVTRNRGAGVMLGDNNRLLYNCLAENGQYGFQVFGSNVVMDHNEIAGNNTDNWEFQSPGCGCTGGGKFWAATNVVLTANYVHHNKSVGLWADTNDIGFLLEGNYISDNDAEGFFYEISYNARIVNNTFKRNAIVKGKSRGGDQFPDGAIYLSESGGDSRVNGGVYGTLEIANNLFEDNWGGVVLWENADRFCNSPSNTSSGHCTKVNPAATLTTCGDPAAGGMVSTEPYYTDCRWATQNVSVTNNDFKISKANIGCTSDLCGRNAVFSNFGSYPAWSPYKGTVIQNDITFNNNNRFSGNRYEGDWKFTPQDTSRILTWDQWRAAPYSQDAGSTKSGTTTTPAPTTTSTTAPSTTSTTAPAPTGNLLDADSAGLEGSIGRWAPWYSAGASQSSLRAHGGAQSLRIDVTATAGWGVQANNWPGFSASAGTRTISFWGLEGSANNPGVTMRVTWRDISGNPLQTDLVASSTLGTTWQQASGTFTAPAGTATAGVDLVNGSGAPGDFLYLDDLQIR